MATAMQESNLGIAPGIDKPNGDGDAGIFQQRTLPGRYGSVEQVNDPANSTRIFLLGADVEKTVPGGAGPKGYHIPGLKNIDGWEDMGVSEGSSGGAALAPILVRMRGTPLRPSASSMR